MTTPVTATWIYVLSCSTAAVAVSTGTLAANIAMLLVLVIMAGVCAVHMGKKKQ